MLVWRWCDGSYAPGGAFYSADPTIPSHAPDATAGAFGLPRMGAMLLYLGAPAAVRAMRCDVHIPTPSLVRVVFVGMLSNAYVAHFNAPSIYAECSDLSPAGSGGSGTEPPAASAAGPAEEEGVACAAGGAAGKAASFVSTARSRSRSHAADETPSEAVAPSLSSDRLLTDQFRGFIRRSGSAPGADSLKRYRLGQRHPLHWAVDPETEAARMAAGMSAFRRVTFFGFGVSTFLFLAISAAGFGTFGTTSKGKLP